MALPTTCFSPICNVPCLWSLASLTYERTIYLLTAADTKSRYRDVIISKQFDSRTDTGFVASWRVIAFRLGVLCVHAVFTYALWIIPVFTESPVALPSSRHMSQIGISVSMRQPSASAECTGIARATIQDWFESCQAMVLRREILACRYTALPRGSHLVISWY